MVKHLRLAKNRVCFPSLNVLLYTVLDNIYNLCGIPAGQSLLEMVSLTLLYTEAPDHTDTQ